MSASLVGSEMCIRDRWWVIRAFGYPGCQVVTLRSPRECWCGCLWLSAGACLLYTSDAADDM
eukprot:1924295-Alexandrium_andersonii.AAC.1